MKRFAFAAATLVALVACSGSGGGEPGAASTGAGASTASGSSGAGGSGCPLYVVDAGTDLGTPTMSFATDIMPILTDNCTASNCHGTASSPMGGLYLGTFGTSDTATVYKNIVGPMSGELPTMPFVTPKDPTESYLMHKLDDDQCHFEGACVGKTCGAAMPNMGMTLPVGTRDKVRRWIAQGAKDD